MPVSRQIRWISHSLGIVLPPMNADGRERRPAAAVRLGRAPFKRDTRPTTIKGLSSFKVRYSTGLTSNPVHFAAKA